MELFEAHSMVNQWKLVLHDAAAPAHGVRKPGESSIRFGLSLLQVDKYLSGISAIGVQVKQEIVNLPDIAVCLPSRLWTNLLQTSCTHPLCVQFTVCRLPPTAPQPRSLAAIFEYSCSPCRKLTWYLRVCMIEKLPSALFAAATYADAWSTSDPRKIFTSTMILGHNPPRSSRLPSPARQKSSRPPELRPTVVAPESTQLDDGPCFVKEYEALPNWIIRGRDDCSWSSLLSSSMVATIQLWWRENADPANQQQHQRPPGHQSAKSNNSYSPTEKPTPAVKRKNDMFYGSTLSTLGGGGGGGDSKKPLGTSGYAGVSKNKLLSSKAKNPYAAYSSSCEACKTKVEAGRKYCHRCAHSKNVCAMCGKSPTKSTQKQPVIQGQKFTAK
ncbi:conserved hypothetical protein [Uncinocarpus reesii 1704]|uniref:Cysteine-rich PDZ-binding protein n=1 Tax=Uncinocarpus reesii (strain UAMH 1704) TaxID=336963 RepID=C4JUT8_UNCRE|nr:uncharacterized protein UREG_04891 [Uncinocarpus reesii 1704]EEP80049.1 conserved hypothetical protein [Uncinocarpus reesii 1704]